MLVKKLSSLCMRGHPTQEKYISSVKVQNLPPTSRFCHITFLSSLPPGSGVDGERKISQSRRVGLEFKEGYS